MAAVVVSPAEEYAWERGCAGKDAFPSESAAMAFREHMHHGGFRKRDSIPTSDWEHLTPYRCRFCAEYHLGHE